MVWVGGALGVEGACWPSSPTFMAASLSEEASDSSWSERERASGWGGGMSLARQSFEKGSWSSPQLGQWGGEVGERSGMALESPPLGQVGFWHP